MVSSRVPSRVFTQLSPLVLHAGPISGSKKVETPDRQASTVKDPELVVLFGWMDASLKHLAKYAAGYGDVFPTSPVLLVRSTGRQFLKSAKAQIADLAKATEYLDERRLLGAAEKRRMLMHTFSNGGVAQMMAVARQAKPGGDSKAAVEGDAALAPGALILDSCPGATSLRVMITAFTMPFRSRLMRWALYPVVVFMYLFSVFKRYLPVLFFLPPKLHAIENLAMMLQDPSILSPRTRRTYIYSREDPLIPFRSVEEHAETAKRKDIDVRLERFVGSSHVAHERADSKRYWQIVKETWQASQEDP